MNLDGRRAAHRRLPCLQRGRWGRRQAGLLPAKPSSSELLGITTPEAQLTLLERKVLQNSLGLQGVVTR